MAAPPPLSAVLPPLIFGTATFNSQYNRNPFALPTDQLVARAMSLGVRAFDTSPYYGPSEEILGQALDTEFVRENFPREHYYILTKVGRIAAHRFDYSPAWVRTSIARSLKRLRTPYLDVVYCHDVEFVSPAEVLAAVTALRQIRDETGSVKYIGISGYPVDTLCELSEMILRETHEPLDAVMSYANYTLQNQRLLTSGLPRLVAAGVSVVPNASILGMGLLRRDGVPIGGQGDWHPAPAGLREAIHKASQLLEDRHERMEKVAIRFAVENWIVAGAPVGSRGDPASGLPWQRPADAQAQGPQLGVSVMGVSSVEELDETMRVWRSILDTLDRADVPVRRLEDRSWGLQRRRTVLDLAQQVRALLGQWADVAWDSPPPGFVNEIAPGETDVVANAAIEEKRSRAASGQLPTPASSPDRVADHSI